MNEERFLEVAAQVMSDNTPLPLTISIKEAWLLVSVLQLGTRHPNISRAQRSMFEVLARQFQAAWQTARL
jgi:hypothetical protein